MLQNSVFVMFRPGRLSHRSRRQFVRYLSSNTTQGGSLRLIFEDHSMEIALRKAVGAKHVTFESCSSLDPLQGVLRHCTRFVHAGPLCHPLPSQ